MRNSPKSLVKRMLGPKWYDKLSGLRRHAAIAIRSGANPNLRTVGRYYSTDKYDEKHSFEGLSYLDIYERYLARFRKKQVSILEIGVRDGASLRTWKTYFTKGAIFGIDIDPGCKALEERRIAVEIGSQDDSAFVRNCFGLDQKFDVIIDDGSHVNRMTLASFHNLFYHRLNSRGLYIIEDLGCSYEKLQTEQNILEIWPGMKYNDQRKSFDNDRMEMDEFFLRNISALDHRTGAIRFIHFWSMICVIGKV